MAYYNTKFEDLPINVQTSYLATLDRVGKDTVWGGIALTLNTVENWTNNGFGCFDPNNERTAWFRKKVDGLYRSYLNTNATSVNITSIDNINAELDKAYDMINTLVDRVDKLEVLVYESISKK